MEGDILRLVDAIHRDKSIEKSVIFRGIEEALKVAAEKRLDTSNLEINIDRETGQISATDEEGEPIDPEKLGRIGAHTARRVMMKKIREAEYHSLYEKYKQREGEIVSGSVSRFSGPNMLVTVGKMEGFIPKSHQVKGESYQVGDRIRALIQKVWKEGSQVKMKLSRTDPKFIERLFELEVPEISEGAIEIKKIVNKPGVRTKVAVGSLEEEVDAVGSCVGVRGSRIKGIVSELNNARVDIIQWSDDPKQMVENSLKPAEVNKVELFPDDQLARAIVDDDELSVAIGKGGQNVQLACELTGWDIDVRSTPSKEERNKQQSRKQTSSEETEQEEPPTEETETSEQPQEATETDVEQEQDDSSQEDEENSDDSDDETEHSEASEESDDQSEDTENPEEESEQSSPISIK